MRSRLDRVLVSVLLALTAAAAAGESNPQQKAPVPGGAALEVSQKAAGQLFGVRFRSAKTAPDKSAVAGEMIEAALELRDGSADQYVLLKIAREIASGAGDAATALQAAEEQAERFDLPVAKLKADTLLAARRQATTSAQHKAVAEAALPVVSSLMDADEIDLALRVCDAGRSAAHKCRQSALVKDFTAKADDLKKQQASSQEYRKALAVMENDPADPAANLAAGRYLCLVKGDWERGGPMLTLGSDAALKVGAIMELRGADSAEQQAAIGDAWWDVAETKQGAERDSLRLRAGSWYRQAAPKLAGGLAGLKIKQRLEEIQQREADDKAAAFERMKQAFMKDVLENTAVTDIHISGKSSMFVTLSEEKYTNPDNVRVIAERLAKWWGMKAGASYVACRVYLGNEVYATGESSN